MPELHIVDLSHHDSNVDFGELKAAGVVGVILKASQGSTEIDPCYEDFYARAVKVFGDPRLVHSYAFLDGSLAITQAQHFIAATKGRKGLWSDYERNDAYQCSLAKAVDFVHTIKGLTGRFPGVYGSDSAELGDAIDEGHFAGACPLWFARYGPNPPKHAWNIWQYSERGHIGSMAGLDFSTFNGSREECEAWMKSLAG